MAKMAAGRVLPWPFDVLAANQLGSVFHQVMEDLMGMPAADRTFDAALGLLDQIEREGYSGFGVC